MIVRRWLGLLGAAFLLVACPAQAQGAGAAQTFAHMSDAEVVRRVNAMVARLRVRPEFVGLSIAVARGDHVIVDRGYGMADLEWRQPATAATPFRIGSLTKQFTAAAILKLQEQRKLRTSDHVSKFLPDYPNGARITIAQLLTHTSGIPNYTETPGFLDTVNRPITLSELVRLFQDEPLDFTPGAEVHYSNSNYVLLARIIEQVSGTSYPDFLRRVILKPLGLRQTDIATAPEGHPNEAHGYQFNGPEFLPALPWDMSRGMGALSLASSVDDLFRWTEALFQHRVISKASLDAALTPPKFANEDFEGGYGYGLIRSVWRGTPAIQHGGIVHGFNSYLLRLPRQNFTVVILSNSLPSAPGIDPAKLAHLVATFYLGGELPRRTWPEPRLDIPAATLDTLTGRYLFRPLPMTISPGPGSSLYVQFAAEPPVEIFASSATDFYSPRADLRIRFMKDPTGVVTKAVLYQDGSRQEGKHIERGPPRESENGLQLERFQVHQVVR